MKILITGGLGHVGSYLIKDDFSFWGHDLTIVDDLSTQRYCSLFKPKRSFSFIEGKFQNLHKDFLSQFDAVFHLAGKTNAVESINNRFDYIKENYEDAIRFWNECREAGVHLFVFPSTTSVYGMGEGQMLEDDEKFINPQSGYAESKWLFEQQVAETRLKWWDRTNTVILRLGTIYGASPGMRFHTAINKFCWQAALEQPITVWKENLDFHRPYLGLSDLANVFEDVLTNEKMWNQTFNVVSENKTMKDILELLKDACEIYNKKPQIHFTDCPLLNQNTYFVPTTKLKNVSNIQSNSRVKAGINQTLRHLLGVSYD